MGCCGTRKQIAGHIIFKSIDVSIEKCGNEELDQIFQEAAVCLRRAEETRKKLASKYKNMIVETGTCVLKHPTFERSITSYIIQLLIEIYKDVKSEKDKIAKFDFKSLIKFDSVAPFFHLDKNYSERINKELGINLDDNKSLISGKKTISEFIEELFSLQKVFNEMAENVKTISKKGAEFISQVKRKYSSQGTDKISIGQAVDYMDMAKRNLAHVTELLHLVGLISNMMIEITSAIYTISDKILHVTEMTKWNRIAEDAVKNKIFTPMEVVFAYSVDPKVRRIQDWENNIGYKEEEEELKF
jgi:Glu-tRNA(Gln) amidotransferase subunit E-like FAD-binding protein